MVPVPTALKDVFDLDAESAGFSLSTECRFTEALHLASNPVDGPVNMMKLKVFCCRAFELIRD